MKIIAFIFIILLILTRFVSLFVIQPTEMFPKGATLLVMRDEKMKFIDSSNALCIRNDGGIVGMLTGFNKICAALVTGAAENDHVAALPYSDSLYQISFDERIKF
jgi:hypothetical protein